MNWYRMANIEDNTIVIYDFDDTLACGTTDLERVLNIGVDRPYVWLDKFLDDYRKYGDKLYIITARFHKTIGDCKEKIADFLNRFGINFPKSNILCTGFFPSAHACKFNGVKQILDNHDVDRLIFIDDNPANRDAIAKLRRYYPHVEIITI